MTASDIGAISPRCRALMMASAVDSSTSSRSNASRIVVPHTSTPSFPTDAKFAGMLKADNPAIRVGLVGAKAMVDPEGSLKATRAVDFVCREEFDYTCQEVAAGVPLKDI